MSTLANASRVQVSRQAHVAPSPVPSTLPQELAEPATHFRPGLSEAGQRLLEEHFGEQLVWV